MLLVHILSIGLVICIVHYGTAKLILEEVLDEDDACEEVQGGACALDALQVVARHQGFKNSDSKEESVASGHKDLEFELPSWCSSQQKYQDLTRPLSQVFADHPNFKGDARCFFRTAGGAGGRCAAAHAHQNLALYTTFRRQSLEYHPEVPLKPLVINYDDRRIITLNRKNPLSDIFCDAMEWMSTTDGHDGNSLGNVRHLSSNFAQWSNLVHTKCSQLLQTHPDVINMSFTDIMHMTTGLEAPSGTLDVWTPNITKFTLQRMAAAGCLLGTTGCQMAHCTDNVCRHHEAPHLLHHGPEYCGQEGPSNLDTAKALRSDGTISMSSRSEAHLIQESLSQSVDHLTHLSSGTGLKPVANKAGVSNVIKSNRSDKPKLNLIGNNINLKTDSIVDQSSDVKKVYLANNQSNDYKKTQNRSSKDWPLDWIGQALKPFVDAYTSALNHADRDDGESFFNNTKHDHCGPHVFNGSDLDYSIHDYIGNNDPSLNSVCYVGVFSANYVTCTKAKRKQSFPDYVSASHAEMTEEVSHDAESDAELFRLTYNLGALALYTDRRDRPLSDIFCAATEWDRLPKNKISDWKAWQELERQECDKLTAAHPEALKMTLRQFKDENRMLEREGRRDDREWDTKATVDIMRRQAAVKCILGGAGCSMANCAANYCQKSKPSGETIMAHGPEACGPLTGS